MVIRGWLRGGAEGQGARSSQNQPGAARSSQKQPGAARSSKEHCTATHSPPQQGTMLYAHASAASTAAAESTAAASAPGAKQPARRRTARALAARIVIHRRSKSCGRTARPSVETPALPDIRLAIFCRTARVLEPQPPEVSATNRTKRMPCWRHSSAVLRYDLFQSSYWAAAEPRSREAWA